MQKQLRHKKGVFASESPRPQEDMIQSGTHEEEPQSEMWQPSFWYEVERSFRLQEVSARIKIETSVWDADQGFHLQLLEASWSNKKRFWQSSWRGSHKDWLSHTKKAQFIEEIQKKTWLFVWRAKDRNESILLSDLLHAEKPEEVKPKPEVLTLNFHLVLLFWKGCGSRCEAAAQSKSIRKMQVMKEMLLLLLLLLWMVQIICSSSSKRIFILSGSVCWCKHIRKNKNHLLIK